MSSQHKVSVRFIDNNDKLLMSCFDVDVMPRIDDTVSLSDHDIDNNYQVISMHHLFERPTRFDCSGHIQTILVKVRRIING